MRQQNWATGGRYMLPVGGLLKSENTASSLADFKNHIKEGGEIMMITSIDLDNDTAIVNTKLTIDLNNKSITGGLFSESNGSINEGTSDSYAFWVKEGGNLTIKGDGEIKAQEATYSMAVWANGGNVVIKGGTFRNGGDGTDLIYASAGGNVYIYDGEFIGAENTGSESGTANKFSLLNVKDKDYKSGASNIVVYGGIFHGFNPADNLSEGPGTNFVADGYESIEIEPNIWKVQKRKSNIDNTKMYYGTISSPKFKSFSELKESDITQAINAGTLIESDVKTMQANISLKNEGDAIVVLMPSNQYKVYKDNGLKSGKMSFNEINTGTKFHVNGEVKLGNFNVYGEWFMVPGNLLIYIE